MKMLRATDGYLGFLLIVFLATTVEYLKSVGLMLLINFLKLASLSTEVIQGISLGCSAIAFFVSAALSLYFLHKWVHREKL